VGVNRILYQRLLNSVRIPHTRGGEPRQATPNACA